MRGVEAVLAGSGAHREDSSCQRTSDAPGVRVGRTEVTHQVSGRGRCEGITSNVVSMTHARRTWLAVSDDGAAITSSDWGVSQLLMTLREEVRGADSERSVSKVVKMVAAVVMSQELVAERIFLDR